MLPSPLRFADQQLSDPGRAPSAGQHTDEILGKLLGLDPVEIDRLVRAGVVERD
jgi:crotonobetainyl-CoA:carnitine CoA-transferase CaiB-like acyl-CoA transferase